jgi:hypothetical protein
MVDTRTQSTGRRCLGRNELLAGSHGNVLRGSIELLARVNLCLFLKQAIFH